MRKRTHEEFIQRLAGINPNIEVLGTYVNSNTKIKVRCKIDAHIWETRPNDLLRGHGCPKCMEITHDKFIQRFNKLNPYSKDIEVLGTYKGSQTKIKCRCRIDGYEWEATPSNLLRGTGCPKCGEKRIAQKQTKTHEQFMEDLQEINPDIQVLGTYVNAHNKIKCKCTVCGNEWEAQPSNLLNGCGCPICAIINNRKTHDQFIQELQQVNQDIEVLGTYVNSKTKIKCRCKLDGHEWEVVPSSLLIGQGCPKCSGKMKKTHEEFLQDLYKINANIEVLGTYKNGHTKIKCKCKIDGHIWEATPNGLLQGHGCPKCGGALKKTHDQFIQELEQVNPDIIILGRYVNTSTKIKCRCKLDGHEWETRPIDLLRGRGCPKCSINNKRKTHEQFIQLMEVKQPNIEVIGAYTGCNKKIKVKCKIDGYEWETKPNILLSGHGCPKCANRIPWTHNEFLARLKEINPNIVPLQEYKHSQTPIKCKCKVCGYEWKTRPNNLINNNTGCPKCTRQLADIKQTKTHEQFINELAQVNPDIQVLEPYKGAHIKIKVRCKICEHEWQVQPSNLLHGTGCPKCSINNMKKTHEKFIKEMKVKHPNIEVLDTYEKNNIKIKCKCKIDDYEWETLPNTLLSGSGCPKCKGRKHSEQRTKTHEQFIQELQQINPDIQVLGTYVTSKTKIKCRCKICGNEWETRPNDLLNGVGCPICNISKGEKRVAQYLQDNNISYISQYKFNDCRFKLPLPFDFYLPQYNTCIEYDGAFHYNIIKGLRGIDGLIDTKIRDTVKNIYCENNNITLIRIPYYDYDNIEQILDSYLKQEEELAL